MEWMRCVCCEKLQRDFVAWTIALITPVQYVLQQVSCNYETIPNAPKHNEFRVQWGGSGAFVAKNYKVTSWDELSCTYETMPNAPKFYELHRNISLLSNGVDWARLLQKIQTWHRGTNFYINCTCTLCFATSFMQLRNDPKCTQILRNRPKH